MNPKERRKNRLMKKEEDDVKQLNQKPDLVGGRYQI